jgi:hypothetical protein
MLLVYLGALLVQVYGSKRMMVFIQGLGLAAVQDISKAALSKDAPNTQI